jgi:hypothetical protein
MRLFPEGRASLEKIHHELGRRESLAAMAGRRQNENNAFPWPDEAESVDRRQAGERPPRQRLLRNPDDLSLRHTRVMFEFERRQRAIFVPTETDKRDDRADIAASRRQARFFRARIEILALDAHSGRDQDQPPVIGGKKAISRAEPMTVWGGAWVRSSAARTPLRLANATA